MRYSIVTVTLAILSLVDLRSGEMEAGSVEILFSGIRSKEGYIAIGIHNSREGWPREPELEYNWKKSGMTGGIFRAVVPDLTYGTYAIAALDDLNGNLDMDMFLGIPREGWGFSGNPPFRLSAPGFDECAFRIDKPVTRIEIELRYAGKGR